MVKRSLRTFLNGLLDGTGAAEAPRSFSHVWFAHATFGNVQSVLVISGKVRAFSVDFIDFKQVRLFSVIFGDFR